MSSGMRSREQLYIELVYIVSTSFCSQPPSRSLLQPKTLNAWNEVQPTCSSLNVPLAFALLAQAGQPLLLTLSAPRHSSDASLIF